MKRPRGLRLTAIGSLTVAVVAAWAVPAVPSLARASASVASAKINWGPYCNATCKKALALKVANNKVNCQVAFLDDATSFSYGAAQYKVTQQDARKYFPNMKLKVLNGNNDPVTQSQQLDTVVSQGYKVIILDPVVKDALVPATRRAVAKGVKVIVIDRTVSTPVLTTIKAPDVPLGARAALRIVRQLHGHGNVAILSGTPGASPTIDRTTGFESVMKKHHGIHIVANVNGNYDTNQGFTATKDLLARFPAGKLNWIFSEADVMTLGALKAVQQTNRQGSLKITSIDGQNEAISDIARGKLDSDVVYPIVEPMDVIAAAKACTNGSMPKAIHLEYPLVTKQNAKKFLGTNFS